MRFKSIVSKNANFYFFVANLSKWHFSARKSYNDFWQKETGLLSEKEKGLLTNFKKTRVVFSLPSVFEKAFYLEEKPFACLKKALSKKEFTRTKETFDALRTRFEKIYQIELPSLKKWKKRLDVRLNNQKESDKIVSDLAKLYGIEKPDKEVMIYLLFSDPSRAGGGANVDKNSITLELSRCPLEYIKQILGAVWHETTHLCFDRVSFCPKVREMFEGEEKKWLMIKELTASSLFPNGILAHKYFGVAVSQNLHTMLSPKYSDKILELMGNYLEQGRALNEEYIRKVADIIGD